MLCVEDDGLAAFAMSITGPGVFVRRAEAYFALWAGDEAVGVSLSDDCRHWRSEIGFHISGNAFSRACRAFAERGSALGFVAHLSASATCWTLLQHGWVMIIFRSEYGVWAPRIPVGGDASQNRVFSSILISHVASSDNDR